MRITLKEIYEFRKTDSKRDMPASSEKPAMRDLGDKVS
jgi:hypothetical protein